MGSKCEGRLGRSDESDGSSVRRRACRRVVLLCTLFCVGSLLSAGAAFAFSQRTHVFASSFGGPGEGLGQLREPGSVAVSESTGDVYVADRGNKRIDQFGRDGTPIAVWGFGVVDGEQTFEVCTSPGPCKAGTGKGASVAPGEIAVDNSTGPSKGDVYAVIDPLAKHTVLYKLTANGEKIAVLGQGGEKPAKWEGTLEGVAVDGSGTLWVDRAPSGEEGIVEGVVERFTGAAENEFKSTLEPTLESPELESRNEGEVPLCPKPGLAVDSAGERVYLNHERLNTGSLCPAQVLGEEKAKKEELTETLQRVVTAKFKFQLTKPAPEEEFLFEGLSAGVDSQSTDAVAVDQASSASTPLGETAKGDVYLANGDTVTALDSSGALVQHIELPGATPQSGGSALESRTTGDLYVADSAAGQVDIFQPAASGKPIVDGVFPQDQTPTSTKLIARIDPNGATTAYSVQYGTATCLSEPAACTTVHGASELPAVFGDVGAEVELTGLQPDTTYYYRVIAKNEHEGEGESGRRAETFFTTLPSAEGLLIDHRQWQMVSPPSKGGPLGSPNVEEPGTIQAAQDGSALAFGSPSSAPSGETEGNRSIQETQFLFTRGKTEWATQDLTTPHSKGEGFLAGAELPEYQLFSPELSLGIVEPESKASFPFEAPPLSPPLAGETPCPSPPASPCPEKTIYIRDNPPVSPASPEKQLFEEAAANREYLAPGYVPLVTRTYDTAGSEFGSSLELLDATPDLNHAVFKSEVGLTKNSKGVSFTGKGLYESNSTNPGHALQLVSIVPGSGETPANDPSLGGLGIARNAISANGSRILFTDTVGTNPAAELFIRDTAATPATTTRVSAAEAGLSEPNQVELENESVNKVHYETASVDGSRVFFKDTWPLTKESTLHPTEASHPSDLYEFDAETGKLADLTVPQPGESADVLGTIPGASEDGSNIYFVANGVLAPGATRGHCAELAAGEVPPGATCNLYVSMPSPGHAGGRETRLIAILSADDAPDWQGPRGPSETPQEGSLAFVSSHVSPKGRYIAFMSDRSLTGYNNEDVTSLAQGERPDEEVYLYDAQLGRLVCSSCNSNPKARPVGKFVPEQGVGPVIDPSKLWEGHWLAGSIPGWTPNRPKGSSHESRVVSDTGRVFFNSSDALVASDQNHVEDVYEYEPEGVGTCGVNHGCVALISSGSASDGSESVFLDASASGNDAFFLTAEKLLAQDLDTAFDIYDASVCGTSETAACLPMKPAPPVECKGEEACKAPAPGQQQFSTPQSQTFAGPGNTAGSGVLPNKSKAPPKPLTRAQKLAKALKACHKLKKKTRRTACEKRAKKQYGAKAKAKRRAR